METYKRRAPQEHEHECGLTKRPRMTLSQPSTVQQPQQQIFFGLQPGKQFPSTPQHQHLSWSPCPRRVDAAPGVGHYISEDLLLGPELEYQLLFSPAGSQKFAELQQIVFSSPRGHALRGGAAISPFMEFRGRASPKKSPRHRALFHEHQAERQASACSPSALMSSEILAAPLRATCDPIAAVVSGGVLKLTPVPKKSGVLRSSGGVPRMAVGRSVEYLIGFEHLMLYNPEVLPMLRRVFSTADRTFVLEPHEHPAFSSGRRSARRVAIPCFNGDDFHMYILEVDLSWRGQCLRCVDRNECNCTKSLLVAHRADMKKDCMSGIKYCPENETVVFRHHVHEKFKTSTLSDSKIEVTVSLYDTTRRAKTIRWSSECELVARNKGYSK